MKLKQYYLRAEDKADFMEYAKDRINKLGRAYLYNKDKEIEKVFNYCLEHRTSTDIMHNSWCCGEQTGCGITGIKQVDGEILSSQNDILEHQQKEFEQNGYSMLNEELFNLVFCEFEWLMRGKNDYAEKEYKKIIGD